MRHKSYILYQKKKSLCKKLSKILQKSIKFKSFLLSSFHNLLDILTLITNTYVNKNLPIFLICFPNTAYTTE